MNFQLPLAYILLFIAAALPVGHLFVADEFTLFNTTLSHRVWITWSEIIVIVTTLLLLPVNLIKDIKNNVKLFTLLLAWVVTGFMSTYFAENIYASIARQTELCIHILFSYALLNILNVLPKSKYLIYGVLGAFLYSLFYILILRLAVGDIEYNWTIDIPFFKNIRHWGYLQIIALPLSYYLILNKKNSYSGFIIFTLIWASIFWSGGRGSFITATIISIIIFPWLLTPKHSTYLKTLMCIGIALILALIAEVNHAGLSIQRLFFIQLKDIENFNLNKYSAGRIDIYIESLKHLFNNNYLLGFGPDSFRYTTPPLHIMATHPHSLPIQILYDYGIIGFILISLAFWSLIKKAQGKLSLENKIASTALISAVIASAVDGVFYHSYSIYCLSIIFALCLHRSDTLEIKIIKQKNAYQVLLLIPLIAIWAIHTKTYWQFQKPLSSISQISEVEKFPSIILNKYWLTNSKSEKISIAALELAGKYSDNQCGNFLLLELMFQQNTQNQIKNNCHPHTLTLRESGKLFGHE